MTAYFHKEEMNDTEVKSKEEKEMYQKVANLKGKLIVSCQALPNEPLHSSFIMGRMALAAKEGGARGIRANSKEDIKEIRSKVDLPIIGIVKRDYEDSAVYITPTMKEIEELMEVKPDIIAMDATISKRPSNQTLDEFFHEVKEKYPNQLWMADIIGKICLRCETVYKKCRFNTFQPLLANYDSGRENQAWFSGTTDQFNSQRGLSCTGCGDNMDFFIF